MRMKDGPSVEVSTVVDAPADVIWNLVTDLSRMGEWSPEYQGGEWIGGAGGPAVGAKFVGRNKRGEMEWQVQSTVTEAEPGVAFAWKVGDPDNPGARWRISMDAQGDATKVTHHVDLGPGPSGLTMAIERMPDREEDIVANRIREHERNMTETLQGLKAAAEASR